MTPVFEITKLNTCGLKITGLSEGAGEYLPEDSTESVLNKFKYTETVTINVVQLERIDATDLIASTFGNHSTITDEATVNLAKDGNYLVSHIIVPTVTWLENEKNKSGNLLSDYSAIYVSDGIRTYKYIDEELVECPVLELAERNPEGTTISITAKNTFSICYLSKCFVTLCNEILNMNLLKCKSKNADLDDLIFKRDFIWMTINVIKYNIDMEQYKEAQRVLEQVNYCNGLCPDTNSYGKSTYKSSGCGCH